MRVSEIMTCSVEWVKPDATVQHAASRMRSLNVGTLPVCENDRIIGMITDRDITVRAVAEGNDPKVVQVGDVMTPKVVTCFEDQLVGDAGQLMQDNHVRRLLVLNRQNHVVGIVTLGDMALQTHDDALVETTLEAVCEPARRG